LSIMAGLGMAAALAAPAHAQAVNIGTLTCSVASGWGLILGSARALGCNFTAYGGRAERYLGTIWKLGLDIGYTQNGVMVWTVFDSVPGEVLRFREEPVLPGLRRPL